MPPSQSIDGPRAPRRVSIIEDVLGPVMRGPSSSHTAGAHRIASLGRALLGATPQRVHIAFHPEGSYGRVYAAQGADRAFACGLLGLELADPRFQGALDEARAAGLELSFALEPLAGAVHPNTVDLTLAAESGEVLELRALSIGGGLIELTHLQGWPLKLRARAHELLVEVAAGDAAAAAAALGVEEPRGGFAERDGVALVRRSAPEPPSAAMRERLQALAGVRRVREAPPVVLPQRGRGRFASAAEALVLAESADTSLGSVALAHEADLLGLPEDEVLALAGQRLEVMRAAVREGAGENPPGMQLLEPSAGRILAADEAGTLALGGLHSRAAARALAAMHVNSGMGVVCAAPTGGSSGVLPAVLVTLEEECGLAGEDLLFALLAAGAVGVVVAARATFAAEVAGCQVEIGAAGAMAAAAVVEAAGGSASQACDAAAIALQNTMGSVCDLVAGMVEIPCHTRNALAASAAFVNADLVIGGYHNPISLDETVDASMAAGRMLPSELRCTALGGLAATPTAQRMARGDREST